MGYQRNEKLIALDTIRETIDYLVSNNELELQHLSAIGFTPRQRERIPYGISAALYTMSDDIDWSDRTAYDVIWPMVEIYIESLIQTGDMLANSSSQHIGNLIYNLIEKYLLKLVPRFIPSS
tara:strand:+ start:8 stop:373 length:366 start_codon:yes stop_codon:yes gene_type:complete